MFSCLLTEYKLLDNQNMKVMVAPKRLVSKGVVYFLFFLKFFPRSESLEWAGVQISLKSDPRRVLFSNVSSPKLFDPAEASDKQPKSCMARVSLEEIPYDDYLVIEVSSNCA